jgi:hypothetical protein
MAQIKPFADFKLFKSADEAVIKKYTNILPHALINIWKEYGFGSFAKGFLKTINPDEFQELLNETYIKNSNPIPILATALGDIMTYDVAYFGKEKEKCHCINTVHYKDGDDCLVSPVLSLDDDDFFSEELTDSNHYKNILFWGPYLEAVKVYGIIPEYDECYGYVPLLGLGGNATVNNLQIVKIKEHIMLIKEMVGAIQSRDN